jgi:hypothetical protein
MEAGMLVSEDVDGKRAERKRYLQNKDRKRPHIWTPSRVSAMSWRLLWPRRRQYSSSIRRNAALL